MGDQQQQQEPQWSDHYQRWIVTTWDYNHSRYYWMHQVDGQWTFLDWVPIPQTATSAQQMNAVEPMYAGGHGRNDSATYASAHDLRLSKEGTYIQGTYTTADPRPAEPLDPSFFVRNKDFFELGKVFSVLFTEAAGTTVTGYNDAFTKVKYGEYAHSQVRRFVVVRQKKAHCFAIPIFTYNGQGTLKRGVDPADHAIVYSYGQNPTPLQSEQPLGKPPICVILHQPYPPLSNASRLYFGIHHPIQYNVKVKDIGYVHPDFLTTLLECWAVQVQDLNSGTD